MVAADCINVTGRELAHFPTFGAVRSFALSVMYWRAVAQAPALSVRAIASAVISSVLIGSGAGAGRCWVAIAHADGVAVVDLGDDELADFDGRAETGEERKKK